LNKGSVDFIYERGEVYCLKQLKKVLLILSVIGNFELKGGSYILGMVGSLIRGRVVSCFCFKAVGSVGPL